MRLSVDMIVDAHSSDVRRLILVSSDLDILPAVQTVRDLGKKLNYLASSINVNPRIAISCSTRRLLIVSYKFRLYLHPLTWSNALPLA